MFILEQHGVGDVPIARLLCQQWNSLLKGKKALKKQQLTSHQAGLGNLSVLQWIHHNGCAWNGSTCAAAAKGGYSHSTMAEIKRLPLECTLVIWRLEKDIYQYYSG